MKTANQRKILASIAMAAGLGMAPANAADVVFWMNSTIVSGPDAPIYAEIEAFTQETGYSVEVQAVPHNKLEQNLVVAMSGGAGPDVMGLDVAWVAGLSDAGFLADLTEQTNPVASMYQPGPLASGRFEQRQYALPFYTDNVALFVNNEMLKDAGFAAPPATWQELRETAIAMTELGPDKYGLSLGANRYGAFQLYSFIWQNGGEIIDETGVVRVGEPPAVEALDFLAGLYTRDNAVPDSVLTAATWDEVHAPFIQERAGMVISGNWAINAIEKSNPTLDYSIYPMPAGKQAATVIGGYDLAISADSANPEASWQLVRWLTGSRNVPLLRSYNRISAATAAASEAELASLPEKVKPFVVQAEAGHPRPVVAAWSQIHSDILSNVWDLVIREQATAADALAEASDSIKQIKN